MTYTGTIHGTSIQFDRQLPFTEGEQVVVDIRPPVSPRKGSPQAWLTHLAGTLTPDEGERILAGANACRNIDETLWTPSDEFDEFQKLLLNGPVMSDEQFEQFQDLRKGLNA